MMTRTRILLALALAAAAVLVFGQTKSRWNNHGTPGKPHLEARPVCFANLPDDCFVPRIPRPQNGQCPVCMRDFAEALDAARAAALEEAAGIAAKHADHANAMGDMRLDVCASAIAAEIRARIDKEPTA